MAYIPPEDNTLADALQRIKDIKPPEKGVKHDSGKPRWSLLPWQALKEVVDVLTFGSLKYSDNNWQHVAPEKYHDALLRHITSWLGGEKIDPETGKSHLAHACCSILFLLWFEIKSKKQDE